MTLPNMLSYEVDMRTDKYVSVYFRRMYKKKRLAIWQDANGNLIIDYDNKRVVDERVSDGK